MSKICRTFAADLERNIMKAMYKQPNVEISEVKPTTIICASVTEGTGGTGGLGSGGGSGTGETIGD